MTSDTVVPPLICAAQVKAESGVNPRRHPADTDREAPTPAGAAIVGTHYIRISAIRGPVTMDQDVFRVTLSVIIAVAAAEHEAEAAMATDDVPLWRCALADASLYEAKRRRAAVREMMA